jgi:hypothetical protein
MSAAPVQTEREYRLRRGTPPKLAVDDIDEDVERLPADHDVLVDSEGRRAAETDRLGLCGGCSSSVSPRWLCPSRPAARRLIPEATILPLVAAHQWRG